MRLLYKIVTHLPGDPHRSSLARYALGHLNVKYMPGEQASPVLKSSKLFAFKDLASAIEEFNGLPTLQRHIQYQLWACTTYGEIVTASRIEVPNPICIFLEYYWTVGRDSYPELRLTPKGTVFVDNLTLLARIC